METYVYSITEETYQWACKSSMFWQMNGIKRYIYSYDQLFAQHYHLNIEKKNRGLKIYELDYASGIYRNNLFEDFKSLDNQYITIDLKNPFKKHCYFTLWPVSVNKDLFPNFYQLWLSRCG